MKLFVLTTLFTSVAGSIIQSPAIPQTPSTQKFQSVLQKIDTVNQAIPDKEKEQIISILKFIRSRRQNNNGIQQTLSVNPTSVPNPT